VHWHAAVAKDPASDMGCGPAVRVACQWATSGSAAWTRARCLPGQSGVTLGQWLGSHGPAFSSWLGSKLDLRLTSAVACPPKEEAQARGAHAVIGPFAHPRCRGAALKFTASEAATLGAGQVLRVRCIATRPESTRNMRVTRQLRGIDGFESSPSRKDRCAATRPSE
jgi:hypothetical protein